MSVGTDIIVVGGGPVGACCALELARAGASVTLLEREPEICPPESGAHANCGLLVPSDATPLAAPGVLGRGLKWMLDSSSPFYIAPRPSPALARWLWLFRAACSAERAQAAAPVLRALHVLSARLHDELAAQDGENGASTTTASSRSSRRRTGWPRPPRTSRSRAPWASASTRSRPIEARRLFPSLCCELGRRLPLPGGRPPRPDALHARRGTHGRRGRRDRGDRRGGARARAGAGGRARRDHARGSFAAGQVVLAAGAWTPFLTRGLGVRLPVEPAKGYSVDVERPADFPELPLYLGDAHVVLTPLGDSLRLGSTLELAGWDMRVRPRRVAYLRAAGERAIGVPADGPVRQLWRGPRPVTPDGLPVIGRVPGRDRVILATGHCMLGLSLGPATGRLVTQVASGARPEIDLAPLGVQRFA